MSGSTNKKVVIYRFDREPLQGFVKTETWLGEIGIEVLSPAGAIATVPYEDVKVVCFVKEFRGEGWRQERRIFASRPKTEGLWVRAILRDDDFVEGVVPNNLTQLDPQGFLLAPPDANSNNQRLFLPRSALKELKVMGVVGIPARAKKAKAEPAEQIKLFE